MDSSIFLRVSNSNTGSITANTDQSALPCKSKAAPEAVPPVYNHVPADLVPFPMYKAGKSCHTFCTPNSYSIPQYQGGMNFISFAVYSLF